MFSVQNNLRIFKSLAIRLRSDYEQHAAESKSFKILGILISCIVFYKHIKVSNINLKRFIAAPY